MGPHKDFISANKFLILKKDKYCITHIIFIGFNIIPSITICTVEVDKRWVTKTMPKTISP